MNFFYCIIYMNKLPVDIIVEYLGLLQPKELLNLCKTNKKMNEICKTHKDYISKKALEHTFNIKVDIKDSLFIYKYLEKKGLLEKYSFTGNNPKIMYPNDFYCALTWLIPHDNEKVNILKSFIFKIFQGAVHMKSLVSDNSKQVYLVFFHKKTNHLNWLNKYFGKLLPKKEFYFFIDDPNLPEDLDYILENEGFKGYRRTKKETKFEYFET